MGAVRAVQPVQRAHGRQHSDNFFDTKYKSKHRYRLHCNRAKFLELAHSFGNYIGSLRLLGGLGGLSSQNSF